MNLLQIINTIVVIVGVPVIVGALIVVGRKLQILDDLQTMLGKVKINLKIVCDFLVGDEGFDHTELQAYSPLRLTDIGTKLIEEVAFDTTFQDNKTEFFEFINNEHPVQKHDVELAAIKSIYAMHDKEFMRPLKTFFYNYPKRNLPNTAPTLGVYIRDKYLAEHPEIQD